MPGQVEEAAARALGERVGLTPGPDSRATAYIVTTTLAAVFNLGVILVICFLVMPGLNGLSQESAREVKLIQAHQEVSLKNQALNEAILKRQEAFIKDADEFRATLRRLAALMDKIEAKMKD